MRLFDDVELERLQRELDARVEEYSSGSIIGSVDSAENVSDSMEGVAGGDPIFNADGAVGVAGDAVGAISGNEVEGAAAEAEVVDPAVNDELMFDVVVDHEPEDSGEDGGQQHNALAPDDLVGDQLVTVHADGSEEVMVDGHSEFVIDKLSRLARGHEDREDKLVVHWKGGDVTVQDIVQLQQDVPDMVHQIMHPTTRSGRKLVDSSRLANFVRVSLPLVVSKSVKQAGIAFDMSVHGPPLHQRSPLVVAKKMYRVRQALHKVQMKKVRLLEAAAKRERQKAEFRQVEARLEDELDDILKSTNDPEVIAQQLADLCAKSGVLNEGIPDGTVFAKKVYMPQGVQDFTPYTVHTVKYRTPSQALASAKGKQYKDAQTIEYTALLTTGTLGFRARKDLPQGTNIMGHLEITTEKAD